MFRKVFGIFALTVFSGAVSAAVTPYMSYHTDGRTYYVYEKSLAYPRVIQFCHDHGHDDTATFCDPHDLTYLPLPSGGRKMFWIKDPSICSHVGSCLTIWFDNTRYNNWVLKCSRCTQTWYVICEDEDGTNNVTLTSTGSNNVTLGLPGCSETTVTLDNVTYVILPLVTTYENASSLCRQKYNGELMDESLARAKQSELSHVLASSAIKQFWLKGTGSSFCTLLTSSKVIKLPCSDIHGTMCSKNTLPVQRSFIASNYDGPIPKEASYEKVSNVSNDATTLGIIGSWFARSAMDCATMCSDTTHCQSFVYIVKIRVCRLHNLRLTPVVGLTTEHGSEYYFKNM